jgi:hypothetical protein
MIHTEFGRIIVPEKLDGNRMSKMSSLLAFL